MLGRKSSSLDIFQKVPVELSEPTEVGGLFSMVAAICMFAMFYIELFGFLQYKIEGSAIAGYGVGAQDVLNPKVRVHFNISMLAVPCEYAMLDIMDVMGMNTLNITGSVKKTELGTNVVKEVVTNMTQSTHLFADGSYDGLEDLDDESISIYTRMYPVTFVHFYKSESEWSMDFMPTWARFGAVVRDDVSLAPSVKVATVNCDNHPNVCKKYKLHETELTEGNYYKHDLSVNHLIKTAKANIRLDSDGHPEQAAKNLKGDRADMGKYVNNGCNIAGYVDINAVPGNFHIEARSGEGLSINPRTANLSHVVHYFHVTPTVFNTDYSVFTERLFKKIPPEYRLRGELDRISYINDRMHTAFAHHLRIVYTEYQVDTFYRTYVQGGYQLKAMSENIFFEDYETPEARFSFDFSPVSMRVTAKREPWIEFIIKVMAILGGTYSVVGLADAICEKFNSKSRRSLTELK